MKIIHVFPNLAQGGAESQLERLINYSKELGVEHVVISLKNDETALMQRLKKNAVPVYSMGFNSIFSSLLGLFKLRSLLKKLVNEDTVIQCWMYHANFVGLLIAISLGLSKKLVWNIRRTELPKGATGFIALFSASLSNLPGRVVCCAEAAKMSHIAVGYNSRNMLVIRNGIDIEIFRPDDMARVKFRNEISVTENDFVIGMVGRYAPIKGHLYLLQAFERLLMEGKHRSIKLVLVGREIETALPLQALLASSIIKENLILLAERADISKVMPGFDLLCLPSLSEGFPNVVAEAMASGVPALVTNVGDAAIIVDNDDMVVPAADIKKLTEKLSIFLDKSTAEKVDISERARQFIVSQFSIEYAWQEYYKLYKQIIEDY